MLLAVLLHVAVLASFLVAFEFRQREPSAPPLVIQATLTSIPDVVSVPIEPPPETQPEAEPLPEPEPETLPEPPPEPDVEDRRRLEAEKLEQERLIEQRRLEEQKRREEEAEQRRLEQEAEQKRREEEAAERRRQEEAERKRREEEQRKRREEEALEEKRRQAELERQRQIEAQRAENERRRRQDEEIRAATLAEELAREEARNSDEMTAYMFALRQKVVRNWSPPPSAIDGLNCEVRVRQTPSGEVLDAQVMSCNGDGAVERSIEAAVRRASPLPVPQNSLLFEPTIRFIFRPDG